MQSGLVGGFRYCGRLLIFIYTYVKFYCGRNAGMRPTLNIKKRFYIFLEGKTGINIGCLSYALYWGPGPQLRRVS